VFALVAVPDAPSKTWYSVFTCLLYLADGAIFVGTPARVRDFSPQMQRGLAMGFWTLGPVAGYFVLSAVAQAYLPQVVTFAHWQQLYRFSGYAAIVMFVVCLIFLRELSPGVRSQRMAAMNERVLVEALILSLLSASLGCCYGRWFASFTETLESYNPALIATGSSLYGFATRLVGVPFGIIIPHIVGSPVQTASGWRDWFYVCIGCVVVFVPFIFTMHGPWSPRKARADYAAHQEKVAAEISRLQAAEPALGS
jgi:hypothetical protein